MVSFHKKPKRGITKLSMPHRKMIKRSSKKISFDIKEDLIKKKKKKIIRKIVNNAKKIPGNKIEENI